MYNKIYKYLITIVIIILVGIFGYKYLLDISYLDAIYMTIITVSTVGFQEVVSLNNEAKIFTIILILSSLSFFAYAISGIADTLMKGGMGKLIKKINIDKKIEKLSNHYIIYGSGEIAQQAIDYFLKSREHFVVIERDENKVDEFMNNNILTVYCSETDDVIFEKAKIKKAKGMLLALNTDAENVFASLTAKHLNPNLTIVSSVVNDKSIQKLTMAGVDKTININKIGGSRMVNLLIKPHVKSFFDVITKIGEFELNVEEVTVMGGSELDNVTIFNAKIPQKTGLVILAIKKLESEEIKLNPDPNYVLSNGDTMIVIGSENQVNKLRKLSDIKN